jgi:hypothetical protein
VSWCNEVASLIFVSNLRDVRLYHVLYQFNKRQKFIFNLIFTLIALWLLTCGPLTQVGRDDLKETLQKLEEM